MRTFFALLLSASLFVTPLALHAQNVSVSLIPSDTEVDDQWYLSRVNAYAAWDSVSESPHVVIAVIDTGIDTDHPDLEGNIWVNEDEIAGNGIDDDKNGYIDDINGWDFVNNVGDPNPKFIDGAFNDVGINHGTIVAGIIAARGDNAFGVAGITWRVQLMGLKALDDLGEGSVTDVIRAIDYAIANGADIINLSFVGASPSQSLREAIVRAHRAGIMVVAASGNEDVGFSHSLDEQPAYPICYDNGTNMIVGVAATDDLDQKTEFSNYSRSCVDITAPGIGFLGLTVYQPDKMAGATRFTEYVKGYWAGTSMAAPIVTGGLALLKGLDPKITPTEAYHALFTTADDISKLNADFADELGHGRINIGSAVAYVHEKVRSQQGVPITAPLANKAADITLRTNPVTTFTAYAESFTGGARVAGGDSNGDGIGELVVGAGNGGGPHIRIFDTAGTLQGQFFAYAPHFRGGVNVAMGDIDGDGADEIIAGAGNGGGPHIRIFNNKGEVQGQFFAYDPAFRGGVNVAVGDVNGDGTDEIIAGAGDGGGPHVRVFGANSTLIHQFFAYDPNFRGGVNVAAGDTNHNGQAEIVTGAGAGGGPHVRLFSANGTLVDSFFAYDQSFKGGVAVGVVDITTARN